MLETLLDQTLALMNEGARLDDIVSAVRAPEHLLHVSSSYRYDLMTAHDMRFGMRAFVNRGHEPLAPYYGAHEIRDIGGLPGLVGL